MVYAGPSTGCRNCRDRHTRCDGARPFCYRCTSTGRVCFGYRDVCGVVFKDVSKQVADRQLRRQNRKFSASSMPMTGVILPTRPSTNLQTASISYFFAHYVSDQDRDSMPVSRGHFDYLVPIYSTTKPSSALSLAVAVMAGWAMCLHLGPQRLRASLVSLELKATNAVKLALQDPDQRRSDELLLAVLCLDFADHLASKALCQPVSGAHTEGALALVHHRGHDSFTTKSSQSLLSATTSNTLQTALWFQNITDRDAVTMLPEVDASHGSPVLKAQNLLVRTLKLTRALLGPPPTHANVDLAEWHFSLLRRARGLYNEVRVWPSCLPSSWGLATATLPASPYSDTAPFPSLKVAFIIGQWYCCYITALRIYFLAIVKAERFNLTVPDAPQTLLTEAKAVAEALVAFLARFHATAARFPSDRNPFSALLDRTTSAMLPLGSGKGIAFRGGVADAKHYLFNLLGWALLVLVDEPQNYSGFSIQTEATDYIRDEHTKVSAALAADGMRPGLFS